MVLNERKIVIAISGASGSLYAKLLIGRIMGLQDLPAEVGIVYTDTAAGIWEQEIGQKPVFSKPFKQYDNDDFNAPFASGSSRYDTMIICPCSTGMMGRIAHGVSGDLVSRTADVMLKERRRLIIVPRETPYNLIHITNMKLLTEAGAVILPATPSFYNKPSTIEQLALTVVDRIMDLAGFDIDTFRWGGTGANP